MRPSSRIWTSRSACSIQCLVPFGRRSSRKPKRGWRSPQRSRIVRVCIRARDVMAIPLCTFLMGDPIRLSKSHNTEGTTVTQLLLREASCHINIWQVYRKACKGVCCKKIIFRIDSSMSCMLLCSIYSY